MLLTASWVLPINSPPIRNGCVLIEGDQIVQVLPRGNDDSAVDLGNFILLPGLVNAHGHLEFSGLKERLTPTKSFTEWVKKMTNVGAGLKPAPTKTITALLRGGTTTIADHCHPDSAMSFDNIPLRRIIFWEVLGADRERAHNSFEKARVCAEKFGGFVSPHSLYGVHRKVLEELFANVGAQYIEPLRSIHLLESADEEQFFRTGSGPLADYVRQRGGDVPFPKISPVTWLPKGARYLLVHANYLTNEEIALLPALGASVIHCPGSHQFFGHKRFPFESLKEKGVLVALGTDSLASNEEVSMLREMQLFRETYPAVSAEEIVRMATIEGAKILGMDQDIGTIEPRKKADLIAVPITDPKASLYENVLMAKEASFVMINGKICTNL